MVEYNFAIAIMVNMCVSIIDAAEYCWHIMPRPENPIPVSTRIPADSNVFDLRSLKQGHIGWSSRAQVKDLSIN